MKKHFLLFSTILLCVVSLAQTAPSFGVKAGVTSSRMQGEAIDNLSSLLDFTKDAITTNNKTGFFAGGYVNIPVTSQFSIEPGLYYAQKGYEMRGELNIKGAEFLGINANAQLTSHYIDLPILLKGNFNGFQVFAGPQVSYLASTDLHTKAGLLGFNLLNKKMDATEQFNRIDAGITGGIGYQFKNGPSISASYDHGLSRADANKNLNAYNRSFKVGVGFSF